MGVCKGFGDGNAKSGNFFHRRECVSIGALALYELHREPRNFRIAACRKSSRQPVSAASFGAAFRISSREMSSASAAVEAAIAACAAASASFI